MNRAELRIPLATISILLLLSASGFAFHDGGVAHCSGCHITHNSEDGIPQVVGSADGGPMLLLFESEVDLCLSCHASQAGAVMAVDPTNPPPEKGAGNFGFLLEDNINDGPDGAINPIPGSRAGHNVISPTWGITADPNNLSAPGGSYSSANLTCTSCHDPHGNTNYRMLWSSGQTNSSGFTFTQSAPEAIGLDLNGQESRTSHTAYRSGWSGWCSNCHGLFHNRPGDPFDHPSSRGVGANAASTYNQYDGPTSPTGGDPTLAYIPQVPFEDPLMATNSTTGPSASDRFNCMTCHRAHATSAPAALRWDPNVQFLSEDGVISGSYPQPDPYNDPTQRALCVKCHYPEASSHGFAEPCLNCHR